MLDQNVVVLKLDHGYNIGIDKDKITSHEVLEEYKPIKSQTPKIDQDTNLPTVAILSFGGTISSKLDYRSGGVSADYDANDFVAMCPEIKSIANLHAKSITKLMSEDMSSEEWLLMASTVCDELNKSEVTGVVVTQGTDTLHYSTAALSFLLENLNKPVVFTASQRSIDRGSTDAFMNLICAVKAAASWDGSEVVTCMHATSNDDYCHLIRGTKVRKMHTSRRDAFRAINDQPLAKVSVDSIEILHPNYRKRTTNIVTCSGMFETNIALIQIHPGIDPGVIDYYMSKGVKGIVLAATALGHVPTAGKHDLSQVLQKAKDKQIPIIIASQTLYGRVNPYVYTNLRKLSIGFDCIFVSDIMPETAYVKLGCILPKSKDKDEVRRLMQKNIVGEINDIIDDTTFLN